MGIFSDRESVVRMIDSFISAFTESYKEFADSKCPALSSKLPFARQGVECCLAYGKQLFFVFSKD